ncbi:unnamed protein product [Ectocarpus sp. 13 AM-2016]
MPERLSVREPRLRKQRHSPHRRQDCGRNELLLLRLSGGMGRGRLRAVLQRFCLSGQDCQRNPCVGDQLQLLLSHSHGRGVSTRERKSFLLFVRWWRRCLH